MEIISTDDFHELMCKFAFMRTGLFTGAISGRKVMCLDDRIDEKFRAKADTVIRDALGLR
jgi:hypothetical protein